MMGGHSQKSDSFPSSVQYRLDFTNTERRKKREGGDGGIYNFWEKKTLIIELYSSSFSCRHSFSSSLLPTRLKAFLSWPHSPHHYPYSSSEAMIMPTVTLFSQTCHHVTQHLGLAATHISHCKHSHASLLCK